VGGRDEQRLDPRRRRLDEFEVPVRPPAGTESVYFQVPDREGWILQVVFEPHQAPSAAHFRLFRAAAIMASVVLEFAPERRALQVAAG
jgi:hypothetical protein